MARIPDAELERMKAEVSVELADIEQANRLVHEVLGRSLDELPSVTRRVLDQIVDAVKMKPLPRESVRFSRREVREWTGASDTQARAHLERLVELEYLLTHRGKRGQSFEYELVYDGDGSDATHLAGLLDVTTIRSSRGHEVKFAGSTRGQRGAKAGLKRPHRGVLKIPQIQTAQGRAAMSRETKQNCTSTGIKNRMWQCVRRTSGSRCDGKR